MHIKKSTHHPDYKVNRDKVENLFKSGLRPKEIIELTGISKNIVNCQIHRLKKREFVQEEIFDVKEFDNWIV